ncbi:MAG: hypothetical protein ABSF83_02970 [Nitrososphaerales archaeon]|jgi:hypothetical protein
MVSIRAVDDGNGAPVVAKGLEPPFKQGEFYVFDTADDLARYWNKLPPGRRAELMKQSRKEAKDVRLILDGFVHKPAKTK